MTLNTSEFQHLYPFTSRFVEINKFKYHYIDEGSGDPVVMIHGNPTWSFYFRELIKGLSPLYRTIAVDHIGCGLSDKPGLDSYDYRLKSRIDDLELFIDTLNLNEKITLVIHDWGGMIGTAYALRHPDKIARMVILNTAAFLPPGGKKIPLRLWIVRNIASFAIPAVLGLNIFARAALYMAPRKRLSRDVKKGLIAPYNSWKNRIATLKFVQDIPLAPGDHSYDIVKNADDHLHILASIPKLICWGKHDFVFDGTYYEEWKKRFPNAETRLFSDAGHYLLEDEPEKVLHEVKVFLNQTTVQ